MVAASTKTTSRRKTKAVEPKASQPDLQPTPVLEPQTISLLPEVLADDVLARLIIGQKELARAIAAVSPALPAKSGVSILTCLKLSLSADDASIAAFDLETGIKINFHAENLTLQGDRPYEVCLPGKQFSDYISAFSGTLKLDFYQDKVLIQFGRSGYELPTLSAEDYPSLPELDKYSATHLTIPAAHAENILRRISEGGKFASTEESKGIYQGVNLALVDSHLKINSTDATIIYQESFPLEDDEFEISPGDVRSVTIRGKAVLPLCNTTKLIESPALTFLWQYTHLKILATSGNCVIEYVVRLLNGQYPDMAKVLPTNMQFQMSLDYEALSGAVNRVGIAAADGNGEIHEREDQREENREAEHLAPVAGLAREPIGDHHAKDECQRHPEKAYGDAVIR